ncbi:hypothetical protein ES703_36713 [subsurface metagenome]
MKKKEDKRFWFQVGVILTASTIAGFCLALIFALTGFFEGLFMFLMNVLQIIIIVLSLGVALGVGFACLILPVYFVLKFVGYAIGKGMKSAKGSSV